ncbi:hypothetical protein CEUSTIGMA_g14094.t1 [Chlamydomonas eustigma]|uniref:RING-type domain-containing protein n=1 Tax=Chlamydomonas eustigma TaxID=1157962 RepID=A0A250XUE9_9CHLO|nr:hypothetical protein CEUSTIGMA_g14094.t1 [Chlamydomonas eustigma]|eukprot:GAX86687.1 hypothetical protein CEUSTIGMA_g14094.t1 [Chlamydomonas eustigma]
MLQHDWNDLDLADLSPYLGSSSGGGGSMVPPSAAHGLGGWGAMRLRAMFMTAAAAAAGVSHSGGQQSVASMLSSRMMEYHHRSMGEVLRGAMSTGLPPSLLLSDRDFTADDYEALCRLDDQVENRKGASRHEINLLPTVIAGFQKEIQQQGQKDFSAPEVGTCPICLEDVVEGTVMRVLPCCHRFHRDCVDSWLERKATCPICQKSCKS